MFFKFYHCWKLKFCGTQRWSFDTGSVMKTGLSSYLFLSASHNFAQINMNYEYHTNTILFYSLLKVVYCACIFCANTYRGYITELFCYYFRLTHQCLKKKEILKYSELTKYEQINSRKNRHFA